MSITEIPTYLETPPSAPSISPPVDTRLQELPFEKLSWEHFEKLCLRLVRNEAEVESCRQYGERGDEQGGIDLYAHERLSDTYRLYQCKRVKNFGPAKIEGAVSTFLEGEWKERADKFVLCTSESLRKAQRSDAVEEQRKRLRKEEIEFEPWDREKLSTKLKDNPRLVDDFFGRPFVKAFNGSEVAKDLEPRLDVTAVEEFREKLGAFYGSVFQRHDPGLQLPGIGTEQLSVEERFVLPDIVDQRNVSIEGSSRDDEAVEENGSETERFDPRKYTEPYADFDLYDRKRREHRPAPEIDEATYESRQTVEQWLSRSQKNVVLGGPGTGKSALLRFIIIDLLRESPRLELLAEKWGERLPVWVPFGRWTRMIANSPNSDASLEDLLKLWFENLGEGRLWRIAQKALKDERLLLLVDGLDEWSNENAALVALQRLKVFIDRRDIPAILTSRPHGYRRLEFGGSEWQIGEIASFSEDQQEELAGVWFRHWYHQQLPDADEERIQKKSSDEVDTLMRDLRQSKDLIELAEIPLLLSLELTRFSGQSTAFTPRQVNEVLQNENGLVNGTLLRSNVVTGSRGRNGVDRDYTSLR